MGEPALTADWAVDVEPDPIFKSGKPKVFFRGAFHSEPTPFPYTIWDIHPDGRRFLLMRPPALTAAALAATTAAEINIVLDWFEELKKRVPVT